jgi:hypothetical protein
MRQLQKILRNPELFPKAYERLSRSGALAGINATLPENEHTRTQTNNLHKADPTSRRTPPEGYLGYSGGDEYCYMLDRDQKLYLVFDGGDFNDISFIVRDFSKNPAGPQRKMTAEELAEITEVAMTKRPSGGALKAAYTVFDERKKLWGELYKHGETASTGTAPKVGDEVKHNSYTITVTSGPANMTSLQGKQITLH